MHRVECPNCHRSLKLPREVSNARLKCPKCGQVFVGTSHWEGPGGPENPQAPQGSSPAQDADLGVAPISLENFGPAPTKTDASVPPTSSEGSQAPQPQPQAGGAKQMRIASPRGRSKTPAIVAIILVVLLIPVTIIVAYVVTHKHVILKDADGNVVADRGWLPNDEAVRAVEEHTSKREKADKSPASQPPAQAPKPKLTALPSEASSRGASEVGHASVVQVQGDRAFAIESQRVIPDEVGDGGAYCGVIVNHHDTVVESVSLTLKCGPISLPPVKLSWISPGGRVPFTVGFASLTADQRKEAPIAVFSDAELREDMAGWDIPSGEPTDTVSEDKATITVTGIATNRTGAAVRSAKLYADFLTEEGIVQGTVNGQLKLTDLAPQAKSDYTVTYNPTLVGQPHKFHLRVIGSK